MTSKSHTDRNATKRSLQDSALVEGALSINYLVLTAASSIIATLGLIENSVAVIIGAMIIAPLIGPIQAFAFGAIDGDRALIRKSLVTALVGATLAVVISAAIGGIVNISVYGSEVIGRTKPTLLDLGIALAAGAVGGFAKLRPSVANTVAGTAIAVALMPPLCVVGLALSYREWSWAEGAALLFGTNFLGIAVACMLVLLGVGRLEHRSRLGLISTSVATIALLFPLGASFSGIVRQSRTEAIIRDELVAHTVTFRHARLETATFDWYAKPVTANLVVNASATITPSQVRDLQTFIAGRTGQTLRIVMHVNRYDTVEVTPADGIAPPGR